MVDPDKKIDKKWYESKAVWVAIIAAVIGIAQALGVAIPNEVYAVLGALGLYGLRKASLPIK